MRKLLTLILLLAALGSGYFYGFQQGQQSVPHTLSPDSWRLYFSPRGGCTEAIVEELNHAKSNIFIQAYSFTSAPIAQAIVDAKKRGVQVQVILDRSAKTDKYSEADFVAHAGIATRIDSKHSIAHNKIMVIDGVTIVTGSFNFTKAAEEHNAENMLIIRDADMAKRYLQNWHAHEMHSEPYGGR